MTPLRETFAWHWKIGSAHAQFEWAGYGAEWRGQNEMAAEKRTLPWKVFIAEYCLKVYE